MGTQDIAIFLDDWPMELGYTCTQYPIFVQTQMLFRAFLEILWLCATKQLFPIINSFPINFVPRGKTTEKTHLFVPCFNLPTFLRFDLLRRLFPMNSVPPIPIDSRPFPDWNSCSGSKNIIFRHTCINIIYMVGELTYIPIYSHYIPIWFPLAMVYILYTPQKDCSIGEEWW